MRGLYEILVTGAVNSSESIKVDEAGWRWSTRCDGCKLGPAYTRGGECLRCRGERLSKVRSDWASDAALANVMPR